MKKVLLISPTTWPNRWREYYLDAFEAKGDQAYFADEYTGDGWDAVIFMWANKRSMEIMNGIEKKTCPWIVWCRRYEFFEKEFGLINWDRVDHLIFCNKFLHDAFNFSRHVDKVASHLIYNGMDLSAWNPKKSLNGHTLAWVGNIHPKKNPQLALEIVRELIKEDKIYTLHMVGAITDSCLYMHLLHYIGKYELPVIFAGEIKSSQMDTWLDDKDYLLSTSISEGNPNCIIEAMAKGIKPLVYDWPGAQDQFPEDVIFSTSHEAADMIGTGYNPERYRRLVADKFNFEDTFRKVYELI